MRAPSVSFHRRRPGSGRSDGFPVTPGSASAALKRGVHDAFPTIPRAEVIPQAVASVTALVPQQSNHSCLLESLEIRRLLAQPASVTETFTTQPNLSQAIAPRSALARLPARPVGTASPRRRFRAWDLQRAMPAMWAFRSVRQSALVRSAPNTSRPCTKTLPSRAPSRIPTTRLSRNLGAVHAG